MNLSEQFEKETNNYKPFASDFHNIGEYKNAIQEWKNKYISWLENCIPQWIDVNDKLPGDDEIVLWWTDDGHILETDIPHDYDDEDVKKFLRGKSLCGVRIPITHWMPMLKPPITQRGTDAEP